MIVAGQRLPILIATRPVDLRCGHQALALMVRTELNLDPHPGITVIFRSKRWDRLKILVWDGTGLGLVYRVLEQGSFAWPKVQDGTMRLSPVQFEALFEGLDWRRAVAQRVPPRQHEPAVVAEKEAFITELKDLIEKLEGQVGQYWQAKFGPKSEKLDTAQLELALEHRETAIAETLAQIAAVEGKVAASATDPDRTPRLHPRPLSSHRHDPPEMRLPQGAHGRGSGQGTGASLGGRLAEGSPLGPDRHGQTFRAHAVEPAGCGHGKARGADRAIGAGRLDVQDGRADRTGCRSHGSVAEDRSLAALCRRNHGSDS